MDAADVASLVAEILYLEDAGLIDHGKSIFLEYKMSSLEFIDFAFELKTRSGKDIQPEELWPVNEMMTDPAFFVDGQWTTEGVNKLRQVFRCEDMPEQPNRNFLLSLFSIEYVMRRLGADT